MFLKKFILQTEDGSIIREVHFKKGINLILGKRNNKEEGSDKGSSNNLGKTTLLRCIDFCLGSKNVEDMYKDGELKGITNRKVEEFLKGKNPHFILTLSKNFEDGAEWRIERRLNLNSKKDKIINIIDGKRYKYSDFNDELKKRLFGFTDDHPSFRELIGKFLRKDDTQISNILKFNHPSTNNSRYEKIHLFLFGFNATELLAQKAQLERETKEVSNTITVLDNASGNGALVQELYLRQSELNDLIIKREKFQINEAYERESQYLEALQKEISLLEKKKAELNLQTKITQERIDIVN